MKIAKLGLVSLAVVMMGSSITHAKTFSIKINNKTNSIVETFYASPSGVSSWENDLFEDKALAPGGSMTVRFSDDRNVCEYDLLFEFRGDDLEDLTDTIDLCTITEYEISE